MLKQFVIHTEGTKVTD